MVYHVVVGPGTGWANAWVGDADDETGDPADRHLDMPRWFKTTRAIARKCEQMNDANEWVYIHRPGGSGTPPLITCKALIAEVDLSSGTVDLRSHVPLQMAPLIQALAKHQYDYDGMAVDPAQIIVADSGKSGVAQVFLQSINGAISEVTNNGSGFRVLPAGTPVPKPPIGELFWQRYKGLDRIREIESAGRLPQGYHSALQALLEGKGDTWP